MSLAVGKAAQIGPHADAADPDDGGQHPKQIHRKEGQRVIVGILERRQHVVAHIEEDDRQNPTAIRRRMTAVILKR
jgi:hypothetical protein